MPPQATSAMRPSTSGKATRSQKFGRSRDGQAMRGRPQRCSMTSHRLSCGRRGYLYPRVALPASGELPTIPLSRDGIASREKTGMMPAMALLDLARLRDSPLSRDPFDFVVVENFLAAEALSELIDAFPGVPGHGSYPLATLACSPLFARLTEELEGDDMRAAVEDKFGLDLAGRPT